MSHNVITVTGPVSAEKIGFTLPHEHIMVDFIGAGKVGAHRYKKEEVMSVMLPYLEEAQRLGVQTLVECTPMYLARDVGILRDLAHKSGLHILTNTGQYKEPYLPQETFEISAEKLADSWLEEWENGIDGSDVKPGFIKTAVESTTLAPVQQKVIHAAALVSKKSGLTIATHSGAYVPAMEIVSILESEGVDPSKWIFVHAQSERDMSRLLKVANTGAWISLDGLSPESADMHLESLLCLLEAGYEGKTLLSHDAGWYHVGEAAGGSIRPFTYLIDGFIPLAMNRGISSSIIDLITKVNPGRAYAVG